MHLAASAEIKLVFGVTGHITRSSDRITSYTEHFWPFSIISLQMNGPHPNTNAATALYLSIYPLSHSSGHKFVVAGIFT